jgi:hypothetical protein
MYGQQNIKQFLSVINKEIVSTARLCAMKVTGSEQMSIEVLCEEISRNSDTDYETKYIELKKRHW